MAENKEGEIIVHDGSEDSEEAKKEKKVKKNAKSKNAPEVNDNGEEVKEAVANRPSDKQEGDKESPKQGSSEKPKIDEPNIKQDSKPSIKEGLISDLDSEGMRARAGRLGRKLGKRSKDCLLYTSPSPRDVEESRMPSSA